jgi:chromosome partitioning protein
LQKNQRLSGTTGGLFVAPRILTLANQKGGVGKTTTAINLATALAAIGERVLIVDLDPQGNASTGLGISRTDREISAYDVLVGEASVPQAAIMTSVPNVAIVPSTMDLLGVELTIAGHGDRAFKLRNAFKELDGLRINDEPVSYILIDCPPSLNLLTINSLVAADAVLVPLQCEFFALEGLSQLLQTIEQIRSTLNPRLAIQGVVMTMFDKRNNLSEQVLADVRSEMGDLVYDTVIPRNVRLSEAPSYGKPALLYDLKCAGSQAYLRLATEVIRRERRLNAA